jgi:hypothetical protein
MMHGDRCYGCGGTGVRHTAKARRAFSEYITARRRNSEPCVKNLTAGDRVRDYHSPRGTDFVEVVSVTDLGIPCGWSINRVNGEDVKTISDTYYRVELADGTVWEKINGCVLVIRAGVTDPAPFVAKALPARSRQRA